MTSNKLFNHLLSTHGPLGVCRPVEADFPSRMKERLPQPLIDFLCEHGIGTWLQGRFQFCDPDDFQEILEFSLGEDAEIRPQDCAVFGYSAFGILTVWNRKFQDMNIHLSLGEVRAPNLMSGDRFNDDIAVTSDLRSIASDSFDQLDSTGAKLFSRSIKKMGAVGCGECFGFVPILALGGNASLAHVQIMKAQEHFSLLAQSTPFRLMNYRTRPAFVRDIG